MLMLDSVLRYFNHGAQVMGLPYVLPESLLIIFNNRIFLIGILLLWAFYYYTKKIDIYMALLLSFTSLIAISFLTPTYLTWIVPLLLVVGSYTFSAWYNLIVMIFYLLYYSNPYSDPRIAFQSILSFVPLKNYSFLMPPPFFIQKKLIPLIQLFGNYIIPLSCLIFVISKWPKNKMLKNPAPASLPSFFALKNGFVIFHAAIIMCIIMLIILTDTTKMALHFSEIWQNKTDMYAIILCNGKEIGDYSKSTCINIITILLLTTILWSSFLFLKTFKQYKSKGSL
jgi:hypothetical protein